MPVYRVRYTKPLISSGFWHLSAELRTSISSGTKGPPAAARAKEHEVGARSEYRAELLDRLTTQQREQRQVGEAAARNALAVVEDELRLSDVRLDNDERRTMLWLCGGELSSLATIVSLMVLPHSHR